MNRVEKLLRRICEVGAALGGGFLLVIMCLIVIAVIVRFFNHVVPGVYELSELLIVVTVGFAVAYTAYRESHIVVNFVVQRVRPRIRIVLKSIGYIMCAGLWGTIALVSCNVIGERWLTERTDSINAPFLPFRLIWVFALALLTIVFLISSLRGFIKLERE